MAENDDIRSRPAARPVSPPLPVPSPVSQESDSKPPFKLGCLGWSVIVVAILTLLSLIPTWQQAADQRRAEEAAAREQQREDAFIDSAMAQCAEELSEWQGGEPSNYFYQTVSANSGVITLKGGTSANWACQYSYTSFDDRNLELIQVTWDSPSGELTEVRRPGSDGVISDETIQISEECASAFVAAASVPLSAENNNEIYATTSACETVEEWWMAVKKYPNAFGATMYPDDELWIYLVTACGGAEGSPVCRDAEAKGIFD